MKIKKDQKAKTGKAAKDIVPATIGKPPRDPQPIRAPEAPDDTFPFEIVPSQICPPWPGDAAALSFNFGLDSTELFQDSFEFTFPKSMVTGGEMTWAWPDEFIAQNEMISRFSPRTRRINSLKLDASAGSVEPDKDVENALQVVTIFERDELPEEYEKRKQEETEKWLQNKKKGKNPADDLPMKKVKDVSLGMIEMGKPLPGYSVWLSSQLSLLRDRDWKNHDGPYFWKRIYPQVDGVPIFNPSGRYWVKMLFLGQERMVEVDGRMPVDAKFGLLLPRSSTIRDLWPLILSKAFLKLTTPLWRNLNRYITDRNQEIDGLFLYSLTGLLPQHIRMDQVSKQEWNLMKGLLSDEAWTHKTNLVSVHCAVGKTPYIPSMNEISTTEVRNSTDARLSVSKPRSPIEEESKVQKRRFRTNAERFREAAGQALAMATGKKVEFQKKVLPCHVIPGFGYLLFEAFSNPEDFDLQKVKREEIFKNEDEVKTSLAKARAGSPARKLKKHQSPQRVRELQKRKARREKEKDEKRQKLLEKTTHPVEKLLKIKTSVTNTPVINIHCSLTANEVNYAILQLLNREYFQQLEMRALEDLLEKEDRALFDADSHEEEFQINLHSAESSNPDLNHPLKRLNGGTWINTEDFPFAFHELIVYHSPVAFPNRLEMIDLWQETSAAYVPNEKYEVWLLKRDPGAPHNADLLIAFAPMFPDNLDFHPDSISLTVQKYDFETETVEQWKGETKITASSIRVARLTCTVGDEPLVLRPFINSTPCGSAVVVCSNVLVQTMSKLEYLVSKGWTSDQLPLEFSPMSKSMYYVLAKLDLKVTLPSTFLLRLSSSNPALLSSLRLFIINRDQDKDCLESTGAMILNIKTLNSKRLCLEPNNNGYYLVIDGSPLCNTAEGQMTLDYMQKEAGTLTIEPVEMLDPVEFTDIYTANKYGIILKEHLFVGSDTPISLHVRLRRGGQPLQAQGKGKEIVFSEETPLDQPRIIVLELYEGEQLRLKTKGRNQAHFPHFKLTAGVAYLLVCYYDLRDWPDAAVPNQETEGVNWAVRVFACDTVVLVRDTRKEDKEESIRKAWESTQPGRSDQAKVSRARFLIQQKAARGEVLTDAEKLTIKETWEEKRKAKKDAEANPKAKGKAPGKDDKKAKELAQAQAQAAESMIVTEIPKPENHMMVEIKDFLTHIHAPRLVVNNTEFVGKNHLTASQLEEIKTMNQEEVSKWGEYMIERKSMREKYQVELLESIQSSRDRLNHEKTTIESLLQSYKTTRDDYKTAFDQSREATLKLKTALLIPDLPALYDALEQAKHSNVSTDLLRSSREKLVQMVLVDVNGKLKTGIEGNNVEILKQALADVEKYQVEEELDERIVRRARGIVSGIGH